MAYAHEIAKLSTSARLVAERVGRKVCRQLEKASYPIDFDAVASAVLEEMIGRVGNSQYDEVHGGQERFWAMREVAEGVIFEAHPEWDIESDSPVVATMPRARALDPGASEIVTQEDIDRANMLWSDRLGWVSIPND